jgi:large subunit ribosomal protein L30
MAVKDAKATTQTKKVTQPVEKQLRIRLVRSVIGRPRKQREVVKGLGLRRIDSRVVRRDCPEIRGMVNKIPHLLEVEELD